MKILAIDTSAVAASAAISDNGKIISEFYVNVGLQHSRTLMSMVESMINCTDIKLSDIDLFAVSRGPGSFTGIRIGISAIKGMAVVNEIPVIGVSTLEALAENVSVYKGIICSVMDARCSQVYNALFESDGKNITRLCEDRAISTESLRDELKNIKKSVIFVGDGAEMCYNNLKNSLSDIYIAPEEIRFQRAGSVAAVARRKFEAGKKQTADELIPFYLRPPQAVRNLKK